MGGDGRRRSRSRIKWKTWDDLSLADPPIDEFILGMVDLARKELEPFAAAQPTRRHGRIRSFVLHFNACARGLEPGP